ncbi:sigma-70 family RNA polymerase sigma factor [Neptunitalea lumnitzerae]|uniref:RNA polymerase sigma factor n=1 Tax=Neptunitalea lumnitzerae TaxID=2965509 RepID=A0ABQ5MHG3_9FLAO|nr:sigma-70 family RNA polymerase sigma factor [Neptunitalea sp. Y10]GLB48802.1 RNA polymerase sigma factor [Neptunitalea sp. Y10]
MPLNELHPEQWVQNHADYLYNYTIVRVNDEEIAQDIVQDTFLAALKAIPNFKGEAAERTWLFSILKRKIIDHYRKINSNKAKAEVRMQLSTDDGEESSNWIDERAEEDGLNADEIMENEELGLAIQSCLSKLPKKQAQVFTMKTIEGLDTETICNELNMTSSNLWVIIHRARKGLADCLQENWFKN